MKGGGDERFCDLRAGRSGSDGLWKWLVGGVAAADRGSGAMSDETALMKDLQILATRLGARLFRQNVGLAWVGRAEKFQRVKSVSVKPGDVLIRAARPFKAGVVGMSDLGGWMPVTVTADMVGKTLAVVAQVEVKDGARATEEQLKWIAAVQAAGGMAGVAHNEAELCMILNPAVSGAPCAKSRSTE